MLIAGVLSLLTRTHTHTVNHDQEISFDEFIPWYHRMAEKNYIRFVQGFSGWGQGLGLRFTCQLLGGDLGF